MNIHQFEYIIALSELKHFEQAADKCNISQSTLSTMIAKFEDEIGIPIFSRKTKPLTVTKEGYKIISQLKTIRQQINMLDEIANELKGDVKGQIRIGILPTIAPFLLPLFLRDFSVKYPALTIEIAELRTGEIIDSLKTGDLDIGIVSLPLDETGVTEIPLYEEPFILYDESTSYNHPVNISKIDLNNFWILEEGHCMGSQVQKFCELKSSQLNSSLNIKFKTGSINSLLRMVKANKGKTIVPYLSIFDCHSKDKKNYYLFEEPMPVRVIGVIVNEFFVRKKVLNILKQEIQAKTSSVLNHFSSKGHVILPFE